MSFPKMDNSIKSAINDLKEIVSRHQGEHQDAVSLVSDIESIISDIETKASELAKSSRSAKSSEIPQQNAIDGIAVTNPVTGTVPAV